MSKFKVLMLVALRKYFLPSFSFNVFKHPPTPTHTHGQARHDTGTCTCIVIMLNFEQVMQYLTPIVHMFCMLYIYITIKMIM